MNEWGRRIETEGKAKVVVSVWGAEFVQFLAALAVLLRGLFERKGEIHPIFPNRPKKNSYSSAARNWTNFAPQTDATTFALSSNPSLLLCHL